MTARKKSALALVLAACIGLALWLPTLGLNDLDDASSNETIFTRGPLVRILFDNKWDDQSPLFFAVLHFWQRAVGSDLFRIKFLNVLITLGTIAMIFALTRRMCGRRAPAAAAALLFAVSPLAGWYASVGRMYPMIALLTGLSALALLKYLENGRSSVAAAFVAFTALGAYNHFFGLWASGLLYLFWLGVALWRFNRDARRDGPLKAAVHGLVPWLSAAALFEMLILPQIIRAGMLTKDPPAYASGWSMPADTSKFFHLVAKFCFLNSAWPPELKVIEGAS